MNFITSTRTLVKHINHSPCPKCEIIFNRFPNFIVELKEWFYEIQNFDPSTHISCAGRGEQDQNALFKAGLSKAEWGKSAHNFNAAIDIFRQIQAGTTYDRPWFEATIGRRLFEHNAQSDATYQFDWYGLKGSPYFELPHVEIKNWHRYNFAVVTPSQSTNGTK